jgi:predicted TIM-barrel fold metal-dependent hydrolase
LAQRRADPVQPERHVIVDISAYLGHWPFHPLRQRSAEDLIALMDRKGIDKAVVSSLDAIFYRNSQAGNEEMADEVQPHWDRLVPFATVNPTYAGWQEDVVRCHEELGMRGIRVYPYYHGYSLGDKCCAELLAVAGERSLPVAISLRMEDRRQRHWLDTAEDLEPTEVVEVVLRFPGTSFMILNGKGDSAVWAPLRGANVVIGISRLSNLRLRAPPGDDSLTGLIACLGADKLAFATGIPIKYADPALLKVEILEADDSVKQAILWRNAARMLGQSDAGKALAIG